MRVPPASWSGGSGAAGGEGVAGGDVAALEAGREPVDTLLRGPVGERVGYDCALGLALQAIVADRRRRPERLLDVALLEPLVTRLRVVRPDPGEAVGLELLADGEPVRPLHGL